VFLDTLVAKALQTARDPLRRTPLAGSDDGGEAARDEHAGAARRRAMSTRGRGDER